MAWTLLGPLDSSDPNRATRLRGSMTVGRNTTSDLLLDDAGVSGSHARLDVDGDRLFVSDVGSRNGTFVNGEAITELTAVVDGDLLQFADVMFRVSRAPDFGGGSTVIVNPVEISRPLIGFSELLAKRAVVPFFQPIVEARAGRPGTYELLGRSTVPGLENPGALFKAAAQLQQEVALSELFREVGAEAAHELGNPHVYMNSHPAENVHWRTMADSMVALRYAHPELKLTLEIHEATVTQPEVMIELRAQLKAHDIGLAYDDFGAGQARLQELLEVPPDVLKFDIGLIRGLDDGPPARRRMVTTLVAMVRELGISVLAEGVETEGETEACVDAGFELLQGFHHGRPAPVEFWLTE